MSQDNTKGEIRHVRGSGPPMLTVEGETISIGDRLFLLGGDTYQGALPLSASAIGIDLTRRTVRFQVLGGREVLYVADGGSNGSGRYWVFANSADARRNAVASCEKAVKAKEEAADRALTELEKTKAKLGEAQRWEPKMDDDVA